LFSTALILMYDIDREVHQGNVEKLGYTLDEKEG
jgi:hypothetical protein